MCVSGAARSKDGDLQLILTEDLSVNYAMKMESNGIPGRVHCSDATVNIVRQYWTKKQSDITTFGFEERGLIDVKGYDDKQKTHFIVENTW